MSSLRRMFGCSKAPERGKGTAGGAQPYNPNENSGIADRSGGPIITTTTAEQQNEPKPKKRHSLPPPISPSVASNRSFTHRPVGECFARCWPPPDTERPLPLRIFVVRHEERGCDATFYSSLTPIGLDNADQLVKNLEQIPIHTVFSSPFLRTLQTVAPYCHSHTLPVHIEYGLYELMVGRSHRRMGILGKKHIDHSTVEVDLANYKPGFKRKDVKPSETLEDMQNRLNVFLRSIFTAHGRAEANWGQNCSASQISNLTTMNAGETLSSPPPPPASTSRNQYSNNSLSISPPAAPSRPREQDRTQNLLLVTHMHACNLMIGLLDPTHPHDHHYPTGHVTELDTGKLVRALFSEGAEAGIDECNSTHLASV